MENSRAYVVKVKYLKDGIERCFESGPYLGVDTIRIVKRLIQDKENFAVYKNIDGVYEEVKFRFLTKSDF